MSLNVNNNVGYTVIGNLTIVDGVASGFIGYPNHPYSGYYLLITNTMDFSSDFEIGSRFKLSSVSGNYCLIGKHGSGLTCAIRPSISSVQYTLTNSAGTQFQKKEFTITKTLQENKWYISKTIKENTTLRSILIEEESGTTILDDYITLTDTIRNGGVAIGVDYADVAYQAFQGSIDLNNTYIKVNGVTWFNGKQQTSPTVNEVYLNRNVGYTVVDGGNIHIENGVVSGFSADDYVRTAKIFPTSNISTLEWGCKFTTGSNVNYQGITGTGSYWGCYGFGISDYGALATVLSFSPNIILRFPASTIKSNSTYISKAYWNATTKEFSAKVSGDNGETWTTSSMVVSDDFSYHDVPVQFGKTQAGNFNGSIDLNETYIKVNGVTWFSGKEQASPTINEVYLDRNVGYDIVGNLLINDGVASGFSDSDYGQLPALTGFNSNFEFNVSFIKTAAGNCGVLAGVNWYLGGIVVNANKVGFSGRTTTTGVQFELYSTKNISLNTHYVANAKREGNTLTLKLYKNGVLEETVTGNLTGITFNLDFIGVSIGRSANGYLIGSIDLNETYIKVNGVTWFNGKQMATTPVWTRSV